ALISRTHPAESVIAIPVVGVGYFFYTHIDYLWRLCQGQLIQAVSKNKPVINRLDSPRFKRDSIEGLEKVVRGHNRVHLGVVEVELQVFRKFICPYPLPYFPDVGSSPAECDLDILNGPPELLRVVTEVVPLYISVRIIQDDSWEVHANIVLDHRGRHFLHRYCGTYRGVPAAQPPIVDVTVGELKDAFTTEFILARREKRLYNRGAQGRPLVKADVELSEIRPKSQREICYGVHIDQPGSFISVGKRQPVV